MTKITVDIPVAHTARVINAIAYWHGYQDQVPDPNNPMGGLISNPESKAVFARKQLVKWMRDSVIAWEQKTALEAAQQAVEKEVNLINLA